MIIRLISIFFYFSILWRHIGTNQALDPTDKPGFRDLPRANSTGHIANFAAILLFIESGQIILLLCASEHLYPPFHDLEHHIIEGYAMEFIKRVEMFMNGELEWHHVGMWIHGPMFISTRSLLSPSSLQQEWPRVLEVECIRCVRNSYCALYITYSMLNR